MKKLPHCVPGSYKWIMKFQHRNYKPFYTSIMALPVQFFKKYFIAGGLAFPFRTGIPGSKKTAQTSAVTLARGLKSNYCPAKTTLTHRFSAFSFSFLVSWLCIHFFWVMDNTQLLTMSATGKRAFRSVPFEGNRNLADVHLQGMDENCSPTLIIIRYLLVFHTITESSKLEEMFKVI